MEFYAVHVYVRIGQHGSISTGVNIINDMVWYQNLILRILPNYY